MSNTHAYVLYKYVFNDRKRADVDVVIMYVSADETKCYLEGCKTIIRDLISMHGKPVQIKSDDELDDEKRFINQQIVNACAIFKNDDRYPDGPNKGKLKLTWPDRYRRIETFHEKLRPDTKFQNMTGIYYGISKKQMQ